MSVFIENEMKKGLVSLHVKRDEEDAREDGLVSVAL